MSSRPLTERERRINTILESLARRCIDQGVIPTDRPSMTPEELDLAFLQIGPDKAPKHFIKYYGLPSDASLDEIIVTCENGGRSLLNVLERLWKEAEVRMSADELARKKEGERDARVRAFMDNLMGRTPSSVEIDKKVQLPPVSTAPEPEKEGSLHDFITDYLRGRGIGPRK